MAGAIVGLPESPVQDVVLRDVQIIAAKGLNVGYAGVTLTHVQIDAAQGPAINKMAGADVTGSERNHRGFPPFPR